MYRLASNILIFITLATIISCSGAAETAREVETNRSAEMQELQRYPQWYPAQTFVDKDSVMMAYATALAGDSASSVSKAVAWARTELKTNLSDRLEAIRSDAAAELGSESGLNAPDFIRALRKADQSVTKAATTGHTQVKSVNSYASYRSYAEVTVTKEEVIRQIGDQLGGYEKAWNAMRQSKAFSNF